jgi:methylated-DNA-[protein]-cysteine S-methyltransferase
VQVLAYEADGWGVGVLYLEGARLLHHELPRTDRSRGLTPGHGAGTDVYVGRGRLLHHEPSRTETSGGLASGHGRKGPVRCLAPDGAETASPGRDGSRLVRRLEAYFAGERVSFADVELDLSWVTAFQRALAAALRAIPYGEVVTYGELAALAGRPAAPRAAGTFCAQNRFPLVVPCHRVIAASGIGGYGSLGARYKRRLLALEGIVA